MRNPILFSLAFVASATAGCQFVGGLDELHLASTSTGGGAGGTGGSGGADGSTTNGSSSSSSSSSSSGQPIIGDIVCGAEVCPIGTTSACCHDEHLKNGMPQTQCVMGQPGADGCVTAGGQKGYETRIKCQFQEHCPMGTVCCAVQADLGGLIWYTSVACQPACVDPNAILCDPAKPVEQCPIVMDAGMPLQTTCKPASLLPDGYSICAK